MLLCGASTQQQELSHDSALTFHQDSLSVFNQTFQHKGQTFWATAVSHATCWHLLLLQIGTLSAASFVSISDDSFASLVLVPGLPPFLHGLLQHLQHPDTVRLLHSQVACYHWKHWFWNTWFHNKSCPKRLIMKLKQKCKTTNDGTTMVGYNVQYFPCKVTLMA